MNEGNRSGIVRKAAFGLLALASSTAPSLAQQKNVYIANDDHTDYIWTADAATYRTAFLQMLDYYLAQADQTVSNPPDTQGRFNCDGAFWLWEYEHNKSAADFNRLMGRIIDGHISAPLTTLVSCYGAQPAEAVLRGMYYAGRIERRYQTRFRLAVAMENQTLPWGLASLWAGAGASYSWRGVCGCASPVNVGDREHDIYWWTGPDGRHVLLKWNSPPQSSWGGYTLGGYAESNAVYSIVNYVTTDPWVIAHYPFSVIGAFGFGGDGLQSTIPDFITVAQQQSNSTTRVVVSNEHDFFEDFEANQSGGLASEAYSYGNDWDTLCTSMAEVTSSVRRSVEELRSAEALAAVGRLSDKTFGNSFTTDRDQAFTNLGLYWEHDWTNDGPASNPGGVPARANWQRALATQIQGYVSALETAGESALGAHIPLSGTSPRFYVFNPLSWSRTDVADFPWTGSSSVHVVEVESGLEVPSQIVTVGAQTYLRVWARNVPSVGYKTYRVESGAGQNYSNAANVLSGNVLDGPRYQVTLDPRGAITSLIDKSQGNREFANQSSGVRLNDLGGSGGTVTVENAGPVSVTLKTVSSANLAHTTRVTLYRTGERIAIQDEITQNFAGPLVWDNVFNLTQPNVRHEEIGAIADARLRTQGGDYATQNARYDWLTLNHFADMAGGDGAGVTLSNADCCFFQLGNSSSGTLDTATPRIGVLAGGQVANGTSLGMPSQSGDSYFLQRFALRSYAARDQVGAMKFSIEHQNPFVCGAVTGTTPTLPAEKFSAVALDNPNVLLWAFKPYEDGSGPGVTVRLWNLAETPQTVHVQLRPGSVAIARSVSHIETDEGPAQVTPQGLETTLPRQGLQTFLLIPRKLAHPQ